MLAGITKRSGVRRSLIAALAIGAASMGGSAQAAVNAGERLKPGQQERSRNGTYTLRMQVDGNLTLFRTGDKKLVWNSQTGGNKGAFAAMGRDGNFVVFSASHAPLYITGTKGGANSRLAVQEDGNAVVYSGDNKALWDAKTDVRVLGNSQILRAGQSRQSRSGRYLLATQADGNVTMFDKQTQTFLWTSQTSGNPGAWATVQRDGALVVFSASREVLYTSGTGGQGDASTRLHVLDDGNAALLTGANAPLWGSKVDVFVLGNGQRLRAGQSRQSRDGSHLLALQADGNLVLYHQPTRRVVWSTGTASPGAFLQLLRDGNLVLLSADKKVLFHTATKSDAKSRLAVQNDGNVVLFSGANAPVWWSRR